MPAEVMREISADVTETAANVGGGLDQLACQTAGRKIDSSTASTRTLAMRSASATAWRTRFLAFGEIDQPRRP